MVAEDINYAIPDAIARRYDLPTEQPTPDRGVAHFESTRQSTPRATRSGALSTATRTAGSSAAHRARTARPSGRFMYGQPTMSNRLTWHFRFRVHNEGPARSIYLAKPSDVARPEAGRGALYR